MIVMRNRLLASTVLAGVMAVSAPVWAQTAQPQEPLNTAPGAADAQDDSSELDEVVVTGSRIRRDPTNSPTPLIQVHRDLLIIRAEAA